MGERRVVFDIECFGNYLLLAFREGNKDPFLIEAIGEAAVLSPKQISQLRAVFTHPDLTIVGFNSRKYDMPVTSMAMQGAPVKRCREFSDYLVEKTGALKDTENVMEAMDKWGVKPLQVRDHIDMIDIAPGKASLKMYAARAGHYCLQDMPVDGAQPTLTSGEIGMVRDYCVNDLAMTQTLLKKLEGAIGVRRGVTTEYGVNVMSKSDAQIAESVLLCEMGVSMSASRRLLKESVWPTAVGYKPPDWINICSGEFQSMLDIAAGGEFQLVRGRLTPPDEFVARRDVSFEGATYRLGVGGLHSSEKARAVIVDPKEEVLVEYDVASYYPSLILRMGLTPPQFGDKFLKTYRRLVERRLEAKREGDKAADKALKIAVNGAFGKLSSEYSPLRAPDLLLAITMTGQFALLMLIERLEGAGLAVISANTDGVLIRMTLDQRREAQDVLKEWQGDTGMSGGVNLFHEAFSESVNSYVLINRATNAVKRKGRFTPAGALDKNPVAAVVQEAFVRWRLDGVDPSQHIDEERDIAPFTIVRGVNTRRDGGGAYGASWRGEKLGRVARWVIVKSGGEPIIDLVNGNKVAMSDNAMPVMDYGNPPVPDVLDHINREAYLEMYHRLSRAVGVETQQRALI